MRHGNAEASLAPALLLSCDQALGKFQSLPLEQPAINAVIEPDQRLMVALFNDPALVEYEQTVQSPDGRKPVGDDQRGAPFHQAFHSPLDLHLAFAVEA